LLINFFFQLILFGLGSSSIALLYLFPLEQFVGDGLFEVFDDAFGSFQLFRLGVYFILSLGDGLVSTFDFPDQLCLPGLKFLLDPFEIVLETFDRLLLGGCLEML
jgi:hypothetical protein